MKLGQQAMEALKDVYKRQESDCSITKKITDKIKREKASEQTKEELSLFVFIRS